MNDLEKRLTDELDVVAGRVHAPYLPMSGLAAAGHRQRLRRRSALTGLAVATVAAVAVVGFVVAGTGPSGADKRAVDPATASSDVLARPLELPYESRLWGGDQPGASDEQFLHVDGRQLQVSATRIEVAQGRTLVARAEGGEESWSEVVDGSLVPVGDGPLTGAPVVGVDGTMAWVEHPGDGQYVAVREAANGRVVTSAAQPARLVPEGLLPDGRLLLSNRAGEVLVWNPDDAAPTTLPPLPRGLRLGVVRPWPGGVAAYRDGVVEVGDVDAAGRFDASWRIDSQGLGVWSDTGETYAEATGGEVRFTTESGITSVPLEAARLRVVGWESDNEVVVAQWIAADQAVTRMWRCSTTELRCAEIVGAPNGGHLLPGLS